MRQMLLAAGFADIVIKTKEKAADVIKDWMPGSDAEKYVSSAYVTAVKPQGKDGIQDDVRVNVHKSDVDAAMLVTASEPKACVTAGV